MIAFGRVKSCFEAVTGLEVAFSSEVEAAEKELLNFYGNNFDISIKGFYLCQSVHFSKHPVGTPYGSVEWVSKITPIQFRI